MQYPVGSLPALWPVCIPELKSRYKGGLIQRQGVGHLQVGAGHSIHGRRPIKYWADTQNQHLLKRVISLNVGILKRVFLKFLSQNAAHLAWWYCWLSMAWFICRYTSQISSKYWNFSEPRFWNLQSTVNLHYWERSWRKLLRLSFIGTEQNLNNKQTQEAKAQRI